MAKLNINDIVDPDDIIEIIYANNGKLSEIEIENIILQKLFIVIAENINTLYNSDVLDTELVDEIITKFKFINENAFRPELLDDVIISDINLVHNIFYYAHKFTKKLLSYNNQELIQKCITGSSRICFKYIYAPNKIISYDFSTIVNPTTDKITYQLFDLDEEDAIDEIKLIADINFGENTII